MVDPAAYTAPLYPHRYSVANATEPPLRSRGGQMAGIRGRRPNPYYFYQCIILSGVCQVLFGSSGGHLYNPLILYNIHNYTQGQFLKSLRRPRGYCGRGGAGPPEVARAAATQRASGGDRRRAAATGQATPRYPTLSTPTPYHIARVWGIVWGIAWDSVG